MTSYLGILVVGFLLATVLTPLAGRLAVAVGAVDHPGDRKIHSRSTPRLGGLAVYVAFWVAFGVGLWMNPRFLRSFDPAVVGLGLGSLILFAVGLVDDIRGVGPLPKLAVQVVAALVAWHFGVRFTLIPDLGALVGGVAANVRLSEAAGLLVTLLWLVGITNAVNFIDGVDALATGLSVIVSVTLFVVALHLGQFFHASLYAALAGALIGFGGHNKYPARIFLGDAGSTFLGFALACVSVMACHKSTALGLLLIPVVALGIPISDTTYVVVRRALAGRSVFSADRGHLHHRLLELGYTPREVVWILYALAITLSLGTFFLINARSEFASLIVVMVTVGAAAVAGKLRLFDPAAWRNAGSATPPEAEESSDVEAPPPDDEGGAQ